MWAWRRLVLPGGIQRQLPLLVARVTRLTRPPIGARWIQIEHVAVAVVVVAASEKCDQMLVGARGIQSQRHFFFSFSFVLLKFSLEKCKL